MTDSILQRQAVRDFTTEAVPQAEMLQLVAAFQASPCGMHQSKVMQAVVVTQPALREKVEKSCDHACYDAPLLFVISTKNGSQFGERDASAAAENVMIEATSLGLGSVYIMGGALKANKNTDLKKELGIDSGFDIQVIVSVGYPAKKVKPEKRDKRYKVTIK